MADIGSVTVPSAGAEGRRTSSVELFWDLVFVFAVTQVTTLLSAHLTWAGFGRGMLILALVWWAWSAYVWAANAQDEESVSLRVVLLIAAVFIFISGLAIPAAFGSEAVLFAATYAVVRLLHLALYADASRRGNAAWSAIWGFALTVAIGMALLIVGAAVNGWGRIVLWAIAVAIDYAGPAWLTRERLRGIQQVAVAHFAERYGLFVIICLGESIVAIGVGATATAHHHLGSRLVVLVALGLLVTVAMWWTYFDRFASVAERRLRTHRDPVLAAADGYSYLHLVIVAGIITFAAGMRLLVRTPGAAPAPDVRLALCGGLALYLAGHVGFGMRLAGVVSYQKLIVAAALLILGGVGGGASAGTLTAIITILLVGLCVAERIAFGRRARNSDPDRAGPSGSPHPISSPPARAEAPADLGFEGMSARVELRGAVDRAYEEILNPEALEFLSELERQFGPRRRKLLEARAERRQRLREGVMLDFLPDTREIREGDWQVAPVRADMQQRWVEITGPTDRKMMINALNSGADGFMADLEDANAPTWRNMVTGQLNLRDAIDRTITYDGSDGRHYELGETTATLLVRPRGWHLPERHLLIDGEPIAGALFDFGLFFFHCARRLLEAGSGPYLYLPKMESHLEARLWKDIFCFAEDAGGIDRGTIKATVLIETLPAAFEMDEILYELRDHSAGLNAGRWDYIFSSIKCFADRPDMVLPDRGDVTMTVPFMRAYTELLAATCHRRGAHAMGGMAALIPSRKDPEANEKALEGVRADKEREVSQGYDGTWVAHPDLVPVAREIFEKGLGGAPNQLERRRDDVHVTAEELQDLASTPGKITEQGLRTDVNVGFQYVSFWLTGRGAAAINSLMEDAATAEISRTQIWQWVHHRVQLEDGRTVTPELVREILDEETSKIRDEVGEEIWQEGRPAETREVFDRVALAPELIEFLTIPAYRYLD